MTEKTTSAVIWMMLIAMLTAVVPGLSALSAALVLAEPLPWNVMTGLALVTLGIVFGVRQAGAKKS